MVNKLALLIGIGIVGAGVYMFLNKGEGTQTPIDNIVNPNDPFQSGGSITTSGGLTSPSTPTPQGYTFNVEAPSFNGVFDTQSGGVTTNNVSTKKSDTTSSGVSSPYAVLTPYGVKSQAPMLPLPSKKDANFQTVSGQNVYVSPTGQQTFVSNVNNLGGTSASPNAGLVGLIGTIFGGNSPYANNPIGGSGFNRY